MKVVISAIPSRASVITEKLRGSKISALLVPEVVAERQLPVRARRHQAPALVARQRHGPPRNAATASRPRYQVGSGGIVNAAVGGQHRDDRVDVGALPGVDVAVDDLAQRLVVERASVACWLRSGSRSSTALWARCSALSTPGGVVSSASAASRAEKPSTSRRMSTARWRAGRCWSAAMKASSTLSRCS